MRLSALRSPPCCQGCGASKVEGLCYGCAVDVRRVHEGEHETACRCAACDTWTRVSERLGAAYALRLAREVAS